MPKPGPDRPITKANDRLNFGDYIQPIKETIIEATRANQLPLSIGIFGRWGSGKTSLMRMVEEELGPSPTTRAEAEKRRKDAGRVLRWSWPALALWALLVVLAIFFTPLIINYFQGFSSFKTVVWLSACYGGLGWVVRAAFDFWIHGYIEHNLNSRHALWLLSLPLLGGVYGLVSVAIAVAVFGLDLQTTWPPTALTIIYLAAIILGAFAPSVIHYVIDLGAQFFRPKKQAEATQQAGVAQSGSAAESSSEPGGNFQVIWFNAWKFANEKELWAALLQEVLRQVQIKAQGVERLRIRRQLWWRSVDWKSSSRDVTLKLLPGLGKTLMAGVGSYMGGWLADTAVSSRFGAELGQAAGAAGGLLVGLASISGWLRANVIEPTAEIDFSKYRKKFSYKDQLTFLAEFSDEFKQVMEIARGKGNPIVLMLDDLDRCLPEQAVSILEAIKLFIGDEAPVIFILGADREFIERAIEVKYEKLIPKDDPDSPRGERFGQLGHEYLEKIVQLSFNLPPIMDTQIDQFIDEIFSDNARVKENSQIFAAGLLPNPRQVIRTINIYNFVSELAEQKGLFYSQIIRPDILAILTVIQYRWPDLYQDLEEKPDLLAALRSSYDPKPPKLAAGLQELVAKHAGKRGLKSLLTMEKAQALKEEDVRLVDYIFLTRPAQPEAQGITPPIEEAQAFEVDEQKRAPEPVVETEAPSRIEELGKVESELSAWKTRVKEWKSQGADTALLSQMERRLENAAVLASRGELRGANSEMEGIRKIAEKIQAALEMRQHEGERPVDAMIGKDGRLVFSRAISYQPVELRIEGFKPGKPGEVIAYLPGDDRREHFPEIRGGDIAYRVMSGQASQVEMHTLGELLGGYLKPVLSMLEPSLQTPYRLRLSAAEESVDVLPWELASVYPDNPPLGLDPRFSLVRGSPSTAMRRVKPLEEWQPGFVLVTPPKGVDDQVKVLQQIKFNFPTLHLPSSDPNEVYAVFTKEQPLIAHMVGLMEVNGGQTISSSLSFQFRGLNVRFNWKDIGLLVIDSPGSASVARKLAEYGASLVLAWNSAYSLEAVRAFYFPFYDTLLRSGQPEFAISEGRRAIAAALSVESPLAFSPVLYMGSSAEDVS